MVPVPAITRAAKTQVAGAGAVEPTKVTPVQIERVPVYTAYHFAVVIVVPVGIAVVLKLALRSQKALRLLT
tara:strand:+ start:314 stop:526 length:213 start_codon:yes stop_codon:yes gene_type:complete